MPLPRLSPLARPIPPPLASRLSSPPPSTTPSSPTAVNSTDSDDDLTDPDNGAFPVPRDNAQHIRLPDGTHILSSPTRVLPHSDALRPAPAGPLTECFRCHLLGHYERTVHPTLAPIATYLCLAILPPLVFGSNATSVITGDIVIDSVPTESVVFAIPLGTSLMTVQLNICLPRSRP